MIRAGILFLIFALPGWVEATTIIASDQASMRLFLLKGEGGWDKPESVIWSWAPDGSQDIPQAHIPWFVNFSDAKAVLDRTHVLATASGGAVLLLRVEDKSVKFYAHAGVNPHSAALLPDGNIVSVSSTDSTLRIFGTDPSTGQFPSSVRSNDYVLPSAHGVVWDGPRERLWALGYSSLREYVYDFNRQDPHLEEANVFDLPENGGHDLYPSYDGTRLLLTTHSKVWAFDLEERRFGPFEPMHDALRVKSLSQRQGAPETLYVQACESWWCDTVRFVGDDTSLTRDRARFYKARWWLPDPLRDPKSDD